MGSSGAFAQFEESNPMAASSVGSGARARSWRRMGCSAETVAYGLIVGLGTALGPLLGVLLDIGLLESIRPLAGYRMIIFGGIVAVLLIVRPRGLLDERLVHRIGRLFVRSPPAKTDGRGKPA